MSFGNEAVIRSTSADKLPQRGRSVDEHGDLVAQDPEPRSTAVRKVVSHTILTLDGVA